MFSVLSDKCVAFSISIWHAVNSFNLYYECTGADAGAFSGAGAVRSVHCEAGLQKDGNGGNVFPANLRFWQPIFASQLK